ncbi:MAG: hypothetical protein GY794_11810 [bacterium]|nr:hypothetical protein [bacterium]
MTVTNNGFRYSERQATLAIESAGLKGVVTPKALATGAEDFNGTVKSTSTGKYLDRLELDAGAKRCLATVCPPAGPNAGAIPTTAKTPNGYTFSLAKAEKLIRDQGLTGLVTAMDVAMTAEKFNGHVSSSSTRKYLAGDELYQGVRELVVEETAKTRQDQHSYSQKYDYRDKMVFLEYGEGGNYIYIDQQRVGCDWSFRENGIISSAIDGSFTTLRELAEAVVDAELDDC